MQFLLRYGQWRAGFELKKVFQVFVQVETIESCLVELGESGFLESENYIFP